MIDLLRSHPYLSEALAAALVAGAVLALIVWSKGRPFAPGAVFRASRLTAGNRLFPCQVLVTPTIVVHHTPRWLGRLEQSIHIAQIASVRIETRLLFSDIYVEATGGVSPISCHGHAKKDAIRVQELITQYQTQYYRAADQARPAAPPSSTLSSGRPSSDT